MSKVSYCSLFQDLIDEYLDKKQRRMQDKDIKKIDPQCLKWTPIRASGPA